MGEYGKHRALVMRRVLTVLLALLASSPAGAVCRQALVLALDVSSSVDETEYALQIHGLARALDDPQVREALIGTGSGHVALMIYEWSGRSQQVDILPWLEIIDDDRVDLAINTLESHQRSHSDYPTSLGFAMGYGAIQLANSPACFRKTMDISGDGVSNDGYRPALAILNFDFSDIVVNGLVILDDDTAELTRYYQQEVIHGFGAFVEIAAGYQDYARAIKRKLLRELTVLAVSELQ